METGVSLQSTQGPLGPSWTQHIAEGASCVSTRSWLPPHKTKMPANALHPVRKKLDISKEPAEWWVKLRTLRVRQTAEKRVLIAGKDSGRGTVHSPGARPNAA